MFNPSSNHDSIPSPQCALGTTPHLSIRKRGKVEIKMAKERQRDGWGKAGKETMFRKKQKRMRTMMAGSRRRETEK